MRAGPAAPAGGRARCSSTVADGGGEGHRGKVARLERLVELLLLGKANPFVQPPLRQPQIGPGFGELRRVRRKHGRIVRVGGAVPRAPAGPAPEHEIVDDLRTTEPGHEVGIVGKVLGLPLAGGSLFAGADEELRDVGKPPSREGRLERELDPGEDDVALLDRVRRVERLTAQRQIEKLVIALRRVKQAGESHGRIAVGAGERLETG